MRSRWSWSCQTWHSSWVSEVVGDLLQRASQQDQVAHVVAREAPEPGQGEQPRHVEDRAPGSVRSGVG